jgi:hypothetical protein
MEVRALGGVGPYRTLSVATLVIAGCFPLTAQTHPATFDKQISPLLAKYCAGCHGGSSPRADVRLEFANEEAARKVAPADGNFWSLVETEVSTKEMPPSNARLKPTDDERNQLAAWIHEKMLVSNKEPDPGPFMVHRLNNRQYANSIRQLLYLPADYNAAADFPPDERGDGFDNNAGTLTISPAA